ncbi:MAG: Crp/Fnr family transcriptional regulator [Flavobacteriales bacterium]|nr:Crp/Fnr family transcriptional regulator [Flavobacteriales bacterium]
MNISEKFDFKSDLLYESLNDSDMKLIESTYERLSFSKGDKIFYEDGIPTGMFQIVSGRVKKFKTVLDKQQQIFYVYGKNDFFGYHALLSNERYQDSCEAIEDVVVNFISAKNFKMLLDKLPMLKDALLVNISHEFGVLANVIGILAQKSLIVRLGLFLLILHKRFRLKENLKKGMNFSREDLANIIGTSRESLSRSLNELKTLDLIFVKGRFIQIKSEDRLEEFVLSHTT